MFLFLHILRMKIHNLGLICHANAHICVDTFNMNPKQYHRYVKNQNEENYCHNFVKSGFLGGFWVLS